MNEQANLFPSVSSNEFFAKLRSKALDWPTCTPVELTAMRYLMSDGIERGFAFGTLDAEVVDVLIEYGASYARNRFDHLLRMQRAAWLLVQSGELVRHENSLAPTEGGWLPSYQSAKYARADRGNEPWWHVPDEMIESDMQHIPKGGMCRTCAHRDRDCSSLPFRSMQVISKSKDVSIVRCTEYQRAEQEASQ